MAVSEFDNRMRFPAPPIDFDDDVGITGQDHDNYPEPGQQPRYDWMRLAIISLLSCQSSTIEPSQRRTGTLWFDRNANIYKYFNGTSFVPLSEAIPVLVSGSGATADEVLTLAEWFAIAQPKLDSIQPKATWSGHCAADTLFIPVPASVQAFLTGIVNLLRPLVYINGLLIDPRHSRFQPSCTTVVELVDGAVLRTGDRFTVITEKFDAFVADEIIA